MSCKTCAKVRKAAVKAGKTVLGVVRKVARTKAGKARARNKT